MKKVLVLASGLFFTLASYSQKSIAPKPSPAAKIEQVVGLTDISIDYSRPGVKGRTIFGKLIPFGKLWRTGANNNTVITFGDDVEIAGKTLTKGSYGIYSKPNATSWEVFFYSEIGKWDIPKDWDETKVAAKAVVTPIKLNDKVETLTLSIDNVSLESASLSIAFENTKVIVPIKVPTRKKTLDNITKITEEDGFRAYFEAATFYSEIGEKAKAKEYIDQAVAKKDPTPFWMSHKQALIYAANGNKKQAIKIAKGSLEASKKANNSHYQNLNTDILQKWGAL